ncbi:hypothetical protein [Cryobacterium sp. GrIS_2_6]|nr:hypothetical protein [Cryobacterium psychrotolerans]MEC5149257.1 hypothetical protein [Cryobacterium psychrotolerans]MEC5149336.1 hypothetical protein [Cryobacterium psychrotolerans]
MSNLDRIYDQIDRAVERGDMTDEEARQEWLGAQQDERRYEDGER